MEQSVIRTASPRDMAAVVTHKAVRETNKGQAQMLTVLEGSRVQPSSQVRQGAAGGKKSCNIKKNADSRCEYLTVLLQRHV